mgnify:CR=1 FL=1
MIGDIHTTKVSRLPLRKSEDTASKNAGFECQLKMCAAKG